MGKVTKKYAEELADQILEKINGVANSGGDINITLQNGVNFSKDALVNTILEDNNIYVPFKRTIQFENLQDETVRSICKPLGEITMTETFNKGYKAEELLQTNLASLDVHCEGISAGTEGTVSYGVPYTNLASGIEEVSANNGKDYAVTYTGKGIDGTEFSANAIYNTKDPSKKEYYISKVASSETLGKEKQEKNVVTSSGISISSTGYNTTQAITVGENNYLWNHFEGTIENGQNNKLYSWEDSIKEDSGRLISSAVCKYNNADYAGVPVEFAVNDFSTGSIYKEENGVIKAATGSLSIVCKYNSKGNIILEKPTFAKKEAASIVNANLGKIGKECVAVVSISTNQLTNVEEVVITPNFSAIKQSQDVLKIVEALKQWNIGSNSNAATLGYNNIWVNTASQNNCFAEDGSYILNSFTSLNDYLKK